MKNEAICYTSFTFSYLAKARVLAKTFKKHNPNVPFVALIVDKIPETVFFDLGQEPFDYVIWADELPIEKFERWVFTHNIVEACTAVKGIGILEIFNRFHPEKIIYLDPDIAVFDRLDKIISLLDKNNIILTPHQLVPENSDDATAIQDNEIGSLKFGIFNFGFYALRTNNEGLRFAQWWADRLEDYCADDVANGLFTDQKWGNHIPVFFEKVYILKDAGYNVASWNLSQRKIVFTIDGGISVNKDPLIFYHFTKLGPVGEAMTSRYARDNIEVYEIWEWYKIQVEKNTEINLPDNYWFYGKFRQGETITNQHREIYKQRQDLQNTFIKPISENGFLDWFNQNLE